MNFFRILKKRPTRIGSLWDRTDRLEAAELIKKGEVVGVFNRGVNALWLDAQNPKAVKKTSADQRVKKEKAVRWL